MHLRSPNNSALDWDIWYRLRDQYLTLELQAQVPQYRRLLYRLIDRKRQVSMLLKEDGSRLSESIPRRNQATPPANSTAAAGSTPVEPSVFVVVSVTIVIKAWGRIEEEASDGKAKPPVRVFSE